MDAVTAENTMSIISIPSKEFSSVVLSVVAVVAAMTKPSQGSVSSLWSSVEQQPRVTQSWWCG
jgi:hypothetical protein